ncbi:phosphopantetheine-binding protein [Lentzea sp. NPDC051213]|uniref:phosphopantetheine-binding protein n=1 Tax=Lentzea sp. NPDC051213 TaxID=3364126 RepID=UPI003798F422
MSEIPETKEELRALIAEKLEVDAAEIADDDDLIEWGLNSVTTMGLAGRWRRAGVDVDAKKLVKDVTVNGWWALLAAA